ncbi:enoyl-CoA hydratase/isomerase family protein [Aeromicrobium sp. HA]|uniref:enoyl-CoA hydratase/isomerase family protein n=1 Tax=Aeromicrobium sp. HA TaxID=3009077 RepID=UPI0022AF665E|nr:enoyl-CoA hydratase/isomerase family protein [Aeromicrobium sp. HA]
MTTSTGIRVAIDGAVATITLARPDRLNGLSRRVLAALLETVEHCVETPEIRALVLTGEGRMFSAGADIDEVRHDARSGGRSSDAVVDDARLGARLCAALESPELVTIAAVHGRAVGGAVALLVSCDLRVLAEDTLVSVPELAMGVPLAWGAMERLIRDLGPTAVRDLLLTGRSMRADEALSRGLATAVVPSAEVMTHARRLADMSAARPSFAVTATLRRILALADHSTALGVDDEAVTLARAVLEPDAVAATQAYLTAVADRGSRGTGQPA